MEANQTSDIIYIPHSKLVPTKRNVRKAKSRTETDAELESSIQANGVLQNLIVAQVPGKDLFEVGAGGRRWRLTGKLIKKGVFQPEHPMPAKVVPYESLRENSLAENWGRDPMHPADEFDAFAELLDEGKTIEELSAKFGKKKKEIDRLLRLQKVHPKIVSAFRNNEISYDAIQAFTITDDQEQQLACFEALLPDVDADDVEAYLTDTYMKSTHKLVKFVGLASYKKAGGGVAGDLFDTTVYITDVAKLTEMANKKMERYRQEQSTGWKWCEIIDNEWDSNQLGRKMTADYKDVPPELEEQIAKTYEELHALEDGEDDWTEEDSRKETQLGEQLDSLESKKEEYRAFSEDQKQMAGCCVYLTRDGEPRTIFGIVKKSDEKAVRSLEKAKANANEGVPTNADTDDECYESQAVKDDLNNVYQQAFQVAIMEHQDLLADMLIFNIVSSSAHQHCWSSSIRCSGVTFSGAGIEETNAARQLSETYESLPLAFLDKDTEVERFTMFRQLSTKDKKRVMSFFVARSLGNPLRSGNDSILMCAATEIGFDPSSYWAPTAENYFSRLQKKSLLNVGVEIHDEQWKDDHSKLSKGELVNLIAGDDRIASWVPPYFRSK